jgi:DNA-directed RNA polymerase specialized sigma24 family protein
LGYSILFCIVPSPSALHDWNRFYGAYRRRTRCYLRRLPCRGDELDLLTWDVLVDAFVSCTHAPGGDVPWTAVRAQARAAARAWMARARHEVIGVAIERAAAPEASERLQRRVWSADYVDKLLSVLTPLQRAALERHCGDGEADREIAIDLGCAPGSLRVVRLRAIRRLRALVGHELPPDSDVQQGGAGRCCAVPGQPRDALASRASSACAGANRERRSRSSP